MSLFLPPFVDPVHDSAGSPKTTALKSVYSPRVARVTLDIFSGADILAIGTELSRQLWNQARNCQDQHFRQTGHYLDRFDLQKVLRVQQDHLHLSDRCFSFVLRRYCCNLSTWLSMKSLYPQARPPGYAPSPQPLLFEVGRNTVAVDAWTYRLTVLNKEIQERHALVKLQVRPGVKMQQVKLIQIQPDLTGRLTYYVELQPKPPGETFAGIDLGIYHLATVAFQSGESIRYDGQAILALDQRTRQRTNHGQSSGSGIRSLRIQLSKRQQTYWRKTKRTRWLAIHNLTYSIVQECLNRGVGTIIIGDLTHIRRRKDYGKLRTWPFDQMVEQIRYKAAEVGIRVIAISERYTSQLCHRCGQRGTRSQNNRLFTCEHCRLMMDADVNGAFNILNRYILSPVLAQMGLPAPSSDWIIKDLIKAREIELPYLGPSYVATFAKNYTIKLRHKS